MAQKNFLDVTINIIGVGKKTRKMEKGCSFENDNHIYRVNNDCKLAIWDKAKEEWYAGNEITMSGEQFDTFEAVANNDKQKGLSKEDINIALKMAEQRKLTDDLQKGLNNNYKAQNVQRYSNNNAFSAYIRKENKNAQPPSLVIFKHGEASDALTISRLVSSKSKTDTNNKQKTQTKNVNVDIPEKTNPPQAKIDNSVKNTTTITNVKNNAKKPAVVQKNKRTTKKAKALPYKRNDIKEVKKLQLSEIGLNLIKNHEILVLYAYDDLGPTYYDKKLKRNMPVPFKKGMKLKGTLTIGYGHTGKDVKPGQKITEKKAEKLLKKDLKESIKGVRKHVKVNLTQNEFNALVSFTYNAGNENFRKSTLLKFVNQHKFEEASQEFGKWTYSKGRLLNGLVKRRMQEKQMFRRV